MFPRTLTLSVVESLQDYFFVNIVEDKQRIRTIIDILSKAAEVSDWQSEIRGKLKLLRRLFAEGLPLLKVATELKVPIDELEKFCDYTSDLLLRNRANELDKDVLMYGKTRQQLRKKEARRLAYEKLKSFEEFKGKLWAIRMVLGASKKHFQELQDFANTYGKVQPGLAAMKPSGQTKHELNRVICHTFSESGKSRLLTIFEPTQGYGEATNIFANYGLVVSVERNTEQHSKAFAVHKYHSADLLESLRESWTIEELLGRVKSEQNFKILMPSHPTNAHTIFPKLKQAGWHFDVIDVDPFHQADVYKMVEEIFPLLANVSLLFVSVNPSPRYGRSKEIANFHGEKDTPEFRDQLWTFDCWRYMWKAYEHGLALIPIVVHKCWTPIEQSGIDRIYFVAARVNREARNKILRGYLDRNKNTLKHCMTSPITQYEIGSIPVLYFGSDINEEDPTNIPNADIITHRLSNVLVQLSKK